MTGVGHGFGSQAALIFGRNTVSNTWICNPIWFEALATWQQCYRTADALLGCYSVGGVESYTHLKQRWCYIGPSMGWISLGWRSLAVVDRHRTQKNRKGRSSVGTLRGLSPQSPSHLTARAFRSTFSPLVCARARTRSRRTTRCDGTMRGHFCIYMSMKERIGAESSKL